MRQQAAHFRYIDILFLYLFPPRWTYCFYFLSRTLVKYQRFKNNQLQHSAMRRIKRVRNRSQDPVRFSKRVSNPPERYPAPEFIVKSRRVVLKPFQGQPRKYRERIRLPMLVIRQSGIHNAGFGLFLGESVRAGQTLTTYSTKQISEAYADFLKMKVKFFSWRMWVQVLI